MSFLLSTETIELAVKCVVLNAIDRVVSEQIDGAVARQIDEALKRRDSAASGNLAGDTTSEWPEPWADMVTRLNLPPDTNLGDFMEAYKSELYAIGLGTFSTVGPDLERELELKAAKRILGVGAK